MTRVEAQLLCVMLQGVMPYKRFSFGVMESGIKVAEVKAVKCAVKICGRVLTIWMEEYEEIRTAYGDVPLAGVCELHMKDPRWN